jgi:hypothetical protein
MAIFLRASLIGIIEGGDPEGSGVFEGVGLPAEEVAAPEYRDEMSFHGG